MEGGALRRRLSSISDIRAIRGRIKIRTLFCHTVQNFPKEQIEGKHVKTKILQKTFLSVAAGFAAFGVYCFFQSKYRKV